MILFDKLTTFRRLAGSVPYVRSRKNFYSRFLTCVTSFNIESDFSYINLDYQCYFDFQEFKLVDTFKVPSSTSLPDITIEVYVCVSSNDILNSIYFKVYV